jgi:hypothetical protein
MTRAPPRIGRRRIVRCAATNALTRALGRRIRLQPFNFRFALDNGGKADGPALF